MIAGAAPFILARRSGNRSGCLILSSTERFSPLSALEVMLVGGEEDIEERRVGLSKMKEREFLVKQCCLCTEIKVQDSRP